MNVVVLEPLGLSNEQLKEILETENGHDITFTYFHDRCEDIEELCRRSEQADIVILSNLVYPKEVIERCPKLKAILVAFTGVDHIDMETCRERGIIVCNSAGYSTSAVSDLVFGMLIASYRKLAENDERARNGGTKDGLIGYELEGKKFGIIGAGAIGSRVAQIAHAFGCEVYIYSRTAKEIPHAIFVDFDYVISECDIISLHVPFTKQTKHMIGKKELKQMKKEAILINTARGPIIDHEALAEALVNKEIGQACLDVLDDEPPFDQQLSILHAPNTIITPHIAFASKQAMVKRAYIVANNLKNYMVGSASNVVK